MGSGHLARLGKHSSVLFVGNLLSRGTGLLLIPLYTAKFASTAEFNYWESLLLASTLVNMVAAHGMTAALQWTLKTGGPGGSELEGPAQQRAISAAMGWILLVSTVLCGGAALAAVPFSRAVLSTDGYAMPLALLMLSQVLRLATYPAEGVLKLRFQTTPPVLMSFGEFLVQVVGTILALLVFDTGLEGIAWAVLLAAAVRFGLGLVWLPEMRRPCLDLGLVRPMVRYGLPLMPGAVASVVISLSDRWFFNLYDMAGDGGLYSFGDKWARLVEIVLITPLVAMWPAVFFNIAKEPDAPRQFGRVATLWVGLGGLCAFTITMAGPALTALFDTSEGQLYAGAARAIGVLTAGYVVLGLVEVARVGFAITGRTGRTAVAMVLAAVVNVGLNIWFIPAMGPMGAAWSTLIAYTVALALVLWLSREVYPQSWEWGRIAWAAAVFVGAALLVDGLGPAPGSVGGASLRVGAVLAVPAFLLATGFLTAEERRAGLVSLGNAWQGLRSRLRPRS